MQPKKRNEGKRDTEAPSTQLAAAVDTLRQVSHMLACDSTGWGGELMNMTTAEES